MSDHAFDGIKVVELGGYIVGALCAALLADLGAEVVKFESQQGDGLRPQGGAFQGWNRGKRGIVVDLHTAEGKTILRQLAVQADVLVQNLRPGIARSWEADYETLAPLNPRLVYLAMPGYGLDGPDAARPGFDPIFQAAGGAMAAQGGPGNPPVFLRVPLSDNAGAMLGAYSVALALYQRARTGRGQFVHGSLLNAAIATQSGEFLRYDGKQDPVRMGNFGTDALNRMYLTEDDWLYLGCQDEAGWRDVCGVLGREDLPADHRFDTADKRHANAADLAAVFEPLFLSADSRHWLDRLEAVGVPCSRVNFSRTLFDHPQIIENDLAVEHESFDIGKLQQRGIVVKLSKTPGIARRPAPGLGEHTDEVLAELDYTPTEITDLRQKRVIL